MNCKILNDNKQNKTKKIESDLYDFENVEINKIDS